jgi:hypothetical protein
MHRKTNLDTDPSGLSMSNGNTPSLHLPKLHRIASSSPVHVKTGIVYRFSQNGKSSPDALLLGFVHGDNAQSINGHVGALSHQGGRSIAI